jgi:hypothetical protein
MVVGESPSYRPSVSFEIEKIIGISVMNEETRYRVQWASSWVNARDLVGCQELIHKFLLQQEQDQQQELQQQQQQTSKGLKQRKRQPNKHQKPKQQQQQKRQQQQQLQQNDGSGEYLSSGDVLDSKIPDDAALEIDIHTTNNNTDDDPHDSQLCHNRDNLSDSDGSYIDEHSEAQTFVMVKLEIPDVEPGEINLDSTTTTKNRSAVKRKMSATSSERQEKERRMCGVWKCCGRFY